MRTAITLFLIAVTTFALAANKLMDDRLAAKAELARFNTGEFFWLN